jgi:hypothetical protein
MAVDISWISEGMPFFAFALIFVLAYAIFAKTKILGESKGINILLSFIFSVIFISFSSVRKYVVNVTVVFAVLLTVLFFFLLIILFIIKEPASFLKPLAIVFIVLLALIAIIAVFYTFPSTQAYLPGESESGANSVLLGIKHFIFGSKFLNGILLLVIAIIVGLIITR